MAARSAAEYAASGGQPKKDGTTPTAPSFASVGASNNCPTPTANEGVGETTPGGAHPLDRQISTPEPPEVNASHACTPVETSHNPVLPGEDREPAE
jgi:hypothetical protein